MSSQKLESTDRKRLTWLVVMAVVLAVVFAAALWLFRPHTFAGAVLQNPAPAGAMAELTYDNGEPVNLEAFRGDVILVYFGYTHCPDLCPTTLATAARAIEQLGDRGDHVHTLMVTVDPSRDGQELLGDYVRHFDERFRGIWGTEEDVRDVASSYGVHFEYDEPDSEGNYLVGHTASLFAVDPEGFPRVIYSVGVPPNALARDIRELMG